ncbi:hypothetical protein CASFOL_039631 [Castilleja foliolosa]|uniref:RRM domain-containing protein n=1 Tax=Castilleja foliolosa TaxID=1961234 RepID=A0ABD3BGS0_9LAMI
MAYSRRSRYSRSPSPYTTYSRSVSRSLSRSRSRSRDSSDVENPGNNLYVTGLSNRVTRRDLGKHFSTEGKVEDVHLVVDPLTRESRGFGFVTMSNLEEAERCIKYLDRSVLEGRVITVEKARRRRGRTPTPGRYLGLKTKAHSVGVLVHVATRLIIREVVRRVTHTKETIGGVAADQTLLITASAVDLIPLTGGIGRILLCITAVEGRIIVLDLHRTITTDLLMTVTTTEVATGITLPRMITTIEVAKGITLPRTIATILAEGIGTGALLLHRDIIRIGDIITGGVYRVVSRQGVARAGTTLEVCHHHLHARACRGVGMANERLLLIADPREGILGVLACLVPLLGLGQDP